MLDNADLNPVCYWFYPRSGDNVQIPIRHGKQQIALAQWLRLGV